MRQTLVDKVAIVTGASSGIGAATARELARRGARVVLAARRADELASQTEAIKRAGGQAIEIPTDVADLTQVERLVARSREAFGRIDVLVNNAGLSWRTPLAETSPEDVTRLVQANLLGAMLLTRAVLNEMIERRQGSIVFVGSVAGRVAIEPLYSAAKYGVRGFALSLRRQLAGSGVDVSLIVPGNTRTAMTGHLRERLQEPEVVANRIADLVGQPSREVVIPFRYYGVVWLEQVLPGLADLAYRWRHRDDPRPASHKGPLPLDRMDQAAREPE